MGVARQLKGWWGPGGGIAVAVVLAVCAWAILRPWWLTGTTPVVVTMKLAEDAVVELGWAGAEEPLRLVPVGEIKDGAAWFWTTELPPRPVYEELCLRFPEGLDDGVLAQFQVLALAPKRHAVRDVSGASLEQWTLEGLEAVKTESDRIRFSATPGAEIRLLEAVDRRPPWFGREAVQAIVSLTAGLAILGGLIFCGLRFPDWLPEPASPEHGWTPRRRWIAVGVFAASASLFLHLNTHAIPEFWLADSTSYTEKALALWQDGTFESGGYEYELNRLPGMPLAMALAFARFGPSLHAATLLQGLVAVFSFGVFFLVVHRWLRPWILWMVMPLTLLSPPVVWASHLIATESLFVSFWVLGTAVFLWSWSVVGARRGWGILLFALVVAAGTLVRANAVLLLCLPGCALVGLSWHWLVARPRERIPVGAMIVLGIPFLATLVANGLWSWRNFEARGYARPSDLGVAVAANGPFISGMFDARALADAEEYAFVLRSRWEKGYYFPGWGLRSYRFKVVTDHYTRLDNESLPALAKSVGAFVDANRARLPLPARLVAWWRVLDWGVRMPARGTFTQDALQRSYAIATGFDNPHRAESLAKRFAWLAKKGPEIAYDEGVSTLWIRLYNRITPLYPWIYRSLLFAGILALLWSVWQGRLLTAVFLAPFFVNLLLNVYLLYVLDRYVQVLDAMLLFGVLAALGAMAPSRSPEPFREPVV